MAVKVDKIFQGDTGSTYEVTGFATASIQGGTFQCELSVKSVSLDNEFLRKTITDLTQDELGFAAVLTAQDSAKLQPGRYTVVLQVSDSADPDFGLETHQPIEILEQGIGENVPTDISEAVPDGIDVRVEIPYVDFSGISIVPASGSFVVVDAAGAEIVASAPITPVVGEVSKLVTVLAVDNALATNLIRDYREIRMTLTEASGAIHEVRKGYVIQARSVLQTGVNSFQSFPQSIVTGMDLSDIGVFKAATPDMQITALIEAYNNIAKLRFQVSDVSYSILTMDETDFELLPADFKRALRRAQIIQADYVLGGDPLERRSQDGLLAETIGESSMFLRHRTPLRLGVTRRVFQTISRYIDFRVGVGRV